ncbi:MAG: tetratricopeptide repeat protein [Acidobacteriaceae bacterium]|nr:tetratricopeptide repeat protein [Acidobacteriaceae bacterium]
MRQLARTFPFVIPVLVQTAKPAVIEADSSPARKSIRRAEEMIVKHPTFYEPYNALAMAEARRARGTSDVKYYADAEKALAKSFELSPNNYEGLKIRTWLLLGRHEFAQALEAAQKLNRRTPDDVIVYGYLADANAELGNYKAAEIAAQWMLNLRPGNVPGLTRGAYLRELFGDLEGAVDFMRTAYDATPTNEVEDRAWLLTQIAHLYLQMGDLTKAEMCANGALGVFPDYHYALGTLGQIRLAQKRYNEAADLMARRYSRAPHAENLYAWAKALKLAGKADEAASNFAAFEKRSVAESAMADNSNHELVFYYADELNKPAEALRIAQMEAARRQDVHTLDCLAWALHVNHRDREALERIDEALAVGVKDPEILSHAAAINLNLNERAGAQSQITSAPRSASSSRNTDRWQWLSSSQ